MALWEKVIFIEPGDLGSVPGTCMVDGKRILTCPLTSMWAVKGGGWVAEKHCHTLNVPEILVPEVFLEFGLTYTEGDILAKTAN